MPSNGDGRTPYDPTLATDPRRRGLSDLRRLLLRRGGRRRRGARSHRRAPQGLCHRFLQACRCSIRRPPPPSRASPAKRAAMAPSSTSPAPTTDPSHSADPGRASAARAVQVEPDRRHRKGAEQGGSGTSSHGPARHVGVATAEPAVQTGRRAVAAPTITLKPPTILCRFEGGAMPEELILRREQPRDTVAIAAIVTAAFGDRRRRSSWMRCARAAGWRCRWWQWLAATVVGHVALSPVSVEGEAGRGQLARAGAAGRCALAPGPRHWAAAGGWCDCPGRGSRRHGRLRARRSRLL